MTTDNPVGPSQSGATDKLRMEKRSPDLWQVVLLNDDYTPFDWVIDVLISIFERTPAEAQAVTTAVHLQGKGVAGTYPRQKAMRLAAKCIQKARREGYPFTCMAMPADADNGGSRLF